MKVQEGHKIYCISSFTMIQFEIKIRKVGNKELKRNIEELDNSMFFRIGTSAEVSFVFGDKTLGWREYWGFGSSLLELLRKIQGDVPLNEWVDLTLDEWPDHLVFQRLAEEKIEIKFRKHIGYVSKFEEITTVTTWKNFINEALKLVDEFVNQAKKMNPEIEKTQQVVEMKKLSQNLLGN